MCDMLKVWEKSSQWDNKMKVSIKMSSKLVSRWRLILYRHGFHCSLAPHEAQLTLTRRLIWRRNIFVDSKSGLMRSWTEEWAAGVKHLLSVVFEAVSGACCHICQSSMCGICRLQHVKLLKSDSPTFVALVKKQISHFSKLFPCSHVQRQFHSHRGLSFLDASQIQWS